MDGHISYSIYRHDAISGVPAAQQSTTFEKVTVLPVIP